MSDDVTSKRPEPVVIPDNFPITKLPSGAAKGAGDLHAWSSRRLAGRAGLPVEKRKLRTPEERAQARQRHAEREQRRFDKARAVERHNALAVYGRFGPIMSEHETKEFGHPKRRRKKRRKK